MKDGGGNYLTAQSVGGKLASADFHGAELEVVRSKCVGRVGCKGIVVKDTKFTFEMITRDNVLKSVWKMTLISILLTVQTAVPKRHTIFRFDIPQYIPLASTQVETTIDAGESSEQLPKMIFELHGSQFENRATDRATKKFKQRRQDDL